MGLHGEGSDHHTKDRLIPVVTAAEPFKEAQVIPARAEQKAGLSQKIAE